MVFQGGGGGQLKTFKLKKKNRETKSSISTPYLANLLITIENSEIVEQIKPTSNKINLFV